MKKIFRVFVSFLLCAASFSCSGFLAEQDTTDYTMSRMSGSRSALESNILGCHRQFAASGFKTGAFCEWLAPASGLAIWGGTSNLSNPQERWTCCHKFTRFSRHPQSYDSFSSFYSAIYRCNSLLESLEDSSVDEAYKSEIAGEAYFLRAMAYFYLVRLYGDVTLTLKAPRTVDAAYGPRENFWVVYCQIIKDLNLAASQMRSFDRMVAVAGGNSSGRVCNYSAIACRSLVYLTIGSLLSHPEDNFWLPSQRTPDFSEIGINTPEDAFRKALADAQDVIEHGPFELCPDYRQLFRWTEPEDWQLKERIWALPRSPESGDAGSGLTQWALPCYYNGTAMVENFGRCRPDRWFFQKWCAAYGGVQGNTANTIGMYVNCGDSRMGVNLVHTSYKGKEGTPYNCYPTDNRIHPLSTNLMKYYGIPYYKKYYDPTFNNSVGNSDFYVMRLAEVYLIAAEASAWLDDPDSAVDYVNVILARARNSVDNGPADEPHDWSAGDFATKEQLLNAIFWERCFEMPFEHHEYFDTHRFGAKWIVENIAKPKNEFLYLSQQEDFVDGDGTLYDGYRTVYYGRDFHYDEDWTLVRKGLINGYPNDELIYNPCLDINKNDPNYGQNPIEVFWR